MTRPVIDGSSFRLLLLIVVGWLDQGASLPLLIEENRMLRRQQGSHPS